MPAIDAATVRKVAHLARLRFSDEEEARLVRDLGRILDHVATLERVPRGDGAAPKMEPTALRADLPRLFGDTEALRALAPAREADQIRVPAVLESDEG